MAYDLNPALWHNHVPKPQLHQVSGTKILVNTVMAHSEGPAVLGDLVTVSWRPLFLFTEQGQASLLLHVRVLLCVGLWRSLFRV